MAVRRDRYAPVPEYQPNPISAKTTGSNGLPLGALLATTSTTSVTAGSTTITLAAITSDVVIGTQLAVYGANTGGTDEIVVVTAVNYNSKTITAVFANAHSGTYNVATIKGVKLGSVTINAKGSATTLALWSGIPGLAGGTPPSSKFAAIDDTQNVGFLDFGCTVDMGLWYTYTGTTAGNITVMTLTDAI